MIRTSGMLIYRSISTECPGRFEVPNIFNPFRNRHPSPQASLGERVNVPSSYSEGSPKAFSAGVSQGGVSLRIVQSVIRPRRNHKIPFATSVIAPSIAMTASAVRLMRSPCLCCDTLRSTFPGSSGSVAPGPKAVERRLASVSPHCFF